MTRVLPLAAPGDTPRRVMTIAGSDSGGSAGLQADMRAFAMLGVHGSAAVTAVTVQNSLGVRAFYEVPIDIVAGQISAVASDIGIEAAKTGMLASKDIIEAIVTTWRGEKLDGVVPLIVDPVCASNNGEPLLHVSALAALRDDLFPMATLVTPNLDEVRLLVGIDVVDDATQRDAARALHALGPRWALVKGGHLRTSRVSSDLLFDGSEFHQFAAPRVDTRNDHGAGDTLAAAITAALAHQLSVPDAVAFGKLWVTECIRTAYPIGHGLGTVNGIAGLHNEPDL
ncbi:hydroxymethylpyrimidine/phosphomethylpyrimidine kinase [Mycolicibacterium iranicum]|uniref:Hydroxymethylpyrimidine/phosphomethylpyrimidine kinase n=1 Tax=Mycolicibacterium iranicum TaxID=912594 RepID=A0A839Q9E2_MYCIR|nr:bifunctional hydroxymethylpyrimidine kinase/phosphomethylpyrimidine kinase [Mycolicibacterium iranicum]MBB2992778.1 hydroxymethylpyrimidine/phosphomethylpyrimidine kinase [Mycolicibacterium iranicum]